MPIVDDLPAAAAIADDDSLPVSQAGMLHQATRAQLVAGLQPAIAISQGHLLGRSSASAGGPESIALGANVSLVGGALSVAAPFNVAALPSGGMPAPGDLVAVGQGGANRAVAYAQFMGGLAGVAGVDAGATHATATGGTQARALADALGDAIPLEAFGALGNGVSDDSAAFGRAVASGRPVRLGAKTYVLNGQFTITTPGTILIGVPGASRLLRATQSGGGAWLAVQADGFRADGVTFDANRAAVSQDSWGVLVTALCTTSEFHRCRFLNAAGAVLGSGLVFQASDPVVCAHVVQDCEFANNTVHGLWVQACIGVQVAQCRAWGNGQNGINADFNDPHFVQKLRLVSLIGNRCWANQRGIAIGNFNATNTQPAVWGNANPDATDVVALGNLCHDNAVYGISASGLGLVIAGNVLNNNGTAANSGAGILANVSGSRIAGNMVNGAALYGIDCGGSIASDVTDNRIIGAGYGINCGGGTNLRVSDNSIAGCTLWGICVNNVETDGHGGSFNLASSNTAISGNAIDFAGTAGGIVLRDGPQGVLVARNEFTGSGSVDNCLWGNTDSLIVADNHFNFTQRFICNPVLHEGSQLLRYPDVADSVTVTYAPLGVQRMMSSYQVLSEGVISFIKVTAAGSGYSQATVSVRGAGPGLNGSGAQAVAMFSGGMVIGVVVSAGGGGYGPLGTVVPVTISGDGSGATAQGFAGAPLADERRLRVRCNGSVLFSRAGSVPLQENWTAADITVPANADVEWRAAYGMWRAAVFAH